ncbi:hypothetical protein PFISCL1PPCAC_7210 [Pristionchus fissidentatus]|uniref:glucuronosyltransferase n=1 Tax=Pristionchus fissidentatus TaxID=1538716 RepID=A0AAV5VCH8_9BILA|nr:hypothetical protein PFISCL1PPCAC_7210 [Pristionchus fissidentatus]
MVRLLITLLTVFLAVDSYKILVYSPAFGHSHSNYMGRIADILAEAGNNVTTIINVMDPHVADVTQLSKIIRVQPSAATNEAFAETIKTNADFFSINNFDPIAAYMFGQVYGKMFATQCKTMLEEPGLVGKLKAEKFDVFFAEHFDLCGVGLAHLIKPKSLISVASCVAFGPQFPEFGIPKSLSYNPTFYMSNLNVHSMLDRFWNIFSDFVLDVSYLPMRKYVHDVYMDKYGADFPSFGEISSHSAFVFTNSEPLIDFATPSISKVIPIGGIGAKAAKPLSEDWVKILTKREKNIVLSFGSIAKSAYLPMEVKLSIVETVKSFPDVTFIWKYEVDDEFTKNIASNVSNLHITKWMPQGDILGHPRISAFITHGGMGSLQETSLNAVPGIFIPLFGDQPRNAGMMEYNRLGKALDKTDVKHPHKFVAVIKEVLEDESIRTNARRVSAMLHKRPFTAKEQLIKYTEFAAEFGPSQALRPKSHDMNFIEYNNLDIIFIALVTTIITLVISLKFLKFAFTNFFCAGKSKKE